MHRPQPSSTLFPYTTLFRSWGVWSFSKNIPAAKALLTHLCQRSSVEQTVAASHGYDIPQFAKLHDFKTWADRKSTRLNSSHRCISYAVFCLKKKNQI